MAEPSRPISVRLDTRTLAALDKLAKHYGVTRSQIIIDVVEGFLADPPENRPRSPFVFTSLPADPTTSTTMTPQKGRKGRKPNAGIFE